MPQFPAKSRFEFSGGNLCLDFANTVNNRTSERRKDLLASYGDLLHWGQEAGVVSPKSAERLRRLAEEAPGHAKSALRSALQAREAIYSLFSAMIGRRGVPGAALATLNTALRQASEHAQIVPRNRHFSWEWALPEESLESVLWPVARAAAELLTSEELVLVRECAAEGCGWLFLDKTKNHRRRWCDMKTCGNRDKARRYYERMKKE
jgi:predicted RNA-binding Zn ribbon-like protein